MNEKTVIIPHFMVFLVLFVFFCAAFGAGYWFHGYVIGRTNSADNVGIEANLSRERELLDRIGEYQHREEARNRREAERITAEGERINRTENAIRAIRQSDRRSGDLLQELTKEAEILADYFRGSCDSFNNDLNSTGSE